MFYVLHLSVAPAVLIAAFKRCFAVMIMPNDNNVFKSPRFGEPSRRLLGVGTTSYVGIVDAVLHSHRTSGYLFGTFANHYLSNRQDANIAGQATGAMSWAFITSLKKNPQQSYISLLNNIRTELEEKYSQKPQLSCSHPLGM